MLKLHVILAVDRAGLVGEDGETHHGVFDVGFLRQAPGLTVLCPASGAELQEMLRWAVYEQNGPVAIRYPRGGDGVYRDSAWDPDHAVVPHRQGSDCAIITYGTMVNQALQAADLLAEQGIGAAVFRLSQLKPLPVRELVATLAAYQSVLVVEEACTGSGIREELAWHLRESAPQCKVTAIDLGDSYVPHGSVDRLYKQYGLDANSIARKAQEVLSNEN